MENNKNFYIFLNKIKKIIFIYNIIFSTIFNSFIHYLLFVNIIIGVIKLILKIFPKIINRIYLLWKKNFDKIHNNLFFFLILIL